MGFTIHSTPAIRLHAEPATDYLMRCTGEAGLAHLRESLVPYVLTVEHARELLVELAEMWGVGEKAKASPAHIWVNHRLVGKKRYGTFRYRDSRIMLRPAPSSDRRGDEVELTVFLHEAAHWVDYLLRGTSDHSKRFKGVLARFYRAFHKRLGVKEGNPFRSADKLPPSEWPRVGSKIKSPDGRLGTVTAHYRTRIGFRTEDGRRWRCAASAVTAVGDYAETNSKIAGALKRKGVR